MRQLAKHPFARGLRCWHTHKIPRIYIEKDDQSDNTCDAGAVFKRSDVNSSVSKTHKGLSKITYNAPIVNDIANPIFLAVDTCNLKIIGKGKKRTVMTVTVLVSPHAK